MLWVVGQMKWGFLSFKNLSKAEYRVNSCPGLELMLYTLHQMLLLEWISLGIQGRFVEVCRQIQLVQLVQSLSRVWLFATPWIATRQASLSITNSRSSLKLICIQSVMPSSHLILCRPLLLLPPIPPTISLFQWVNSSHEVAKVPEFQL